MVKIMGILNLTPDSFWEKSRYNMDVLDAGFDIVDIGAVSTRPGADPVSEEEEWSRLEPVLLDLARKRHPVISIDTTRSEIVRKAHDILGSFIVNDISAGEDDPEMLCTVADLGLGYVAMHKRGGPQDMDGLCDYPGGVMAELLDYFAAFGRKAEKIGIEDWILDPGLGFAKTPRQCWEILERLDELTVFGRPILIGAADKRFTGGDNDRAHRLAIEHGASILRVHEMPEFISAQR